MTAENIENLVQRALDDSVSTERRVEAVRFLGSRKEPNVVDALIHVACSLGGPPQLADTVGRELAAIQYRGAEISDLVLADVSGATYVAYDDELSRLMHEDASSHER